MSILRKNVEFLMAKHQTNDTQVAQRLDVPQTTIYRIRTGDTKNPRIETLAKIADHFRVSVEALTKTDLRSAELSTTRVPITTPFQQVPVVGHVKGGADGFLEELGYPVGEGDGHVEYPARDKNAYALRVRGDSMRPRIRPGEFVIIEPNHQAHPGDDVVVSTRDGRKLLKEFLYERNGDITLGSINLENGPLTLSRAEISAIHYVAAIVPAGAFYKPF
ncbi:MAG: S24 family peptidase [Fluviibacter sp.]